MTHVAKADFDKYNWTNPELAMLTSQWKWSCRKPIFSQKAPAKDGQWRSLTSKWRQDPQWPRTWREEKACMWPYALVFPPRGVRAIPMQVKVCDRDLIWVQLGTRILCKGHFNWRQSILVIEIPQAYEATSRVKKLRICSRSIGQWGCCQLLRVTKIHLPPDVIRTCSLKQRWKATKVSEVSTMLLNECNRLNDWELKDLMQF